MRLDKAGEIDYYEELGVDRNAAPEEIRDSFRALVRLLHPDHQRDENLKATAERQLRKINRIYAVLSDPDRRRRYDASLDGELRPPSLVFSPASAVKAKELITRFVWIGAAVLGVAVVIWLATDPPAAPMAAAPEHVNASSPQPQHAKPEAVYQATPSERLLASVAQSAEAEEIARLKAELRAARNERDEARQALSELKSREEALVHSPTPTPATSTFTSASTTLADPGSPRLSPTLAKPAPVAPAIAPAVRSAKPPVSEAHQFAGFWFFAKSPSGNRNKALYYPEFIEATLTEQNGVVHGRYRSRYQVADRAISPDVNFEFSGTPTGGTIICPWTGQGGAKGQLTLHMTGENDMKVDWAASDVGTIQGLASGTATLTRRLD